MKIDARQISLCYTTQLGGSVPALDHMDFSIGGGEIVGVLGPSGSGKSSLLYLLSGLKKPTTGSVFYDDDDVFRWSPERLDNFRRRNFGFIFQRHYLINHLNILENILLPLNDASPVNKDKALLLMDTLRLSAPANRMPAELSVGQRQLVAVARALINEPRVIFADEPTASLDMDTALAAMDVIAETARTAAVIIVTHDVKILRHSDRIIRLRDGKLK